MKIYCLVSENLTNLGGRMGTEYTTTNFRRYFRKKPKAKEIAQKDYNHHMAPNYKGLTHGPPELRWVKAKKAGDCKTKDLGFVMYHITSINIE